MRKIPPFYCLVEGDKTKIAGRDRNIVTQASAGFHGLTADKILNVDHSGVCKFDTKFGGYMLVLDRLKKIRAELFSTGVGAAANSQNIPGRPKVTAPGYPLASNTKFYEGSDLRAASQLVGRTEALQEIMSLLTIDGPPIPKMIALTGIGGIGKTELLLELALRYRNQRNVFFIRANDLESLEDAFLDIATSIGHDLLASRRSYQDLHAVWRGLEPPDRVRAFKAWLGDADNQPSLFIVDDLDGLRTDTAIKAALPREALVVLYSTRDPSIIGGLRRNCQEFRVPTMDTDEMATLMESILHQSGSTFSQATLSEEELESVAKVVDGNALAGCRAISYIVQVLAQTAETRPAQIFLDVFNGSDWKARKQFLHFKPRFGLSIMETFETSLQRLRRHQIAARRLVQLIAFLSSPDHSLDFRKFLSIERPWLLEFRASLPDYDVFATGLTGQGEYLAELENVSIGFRSIPNGPLQLHPLWTECIHQRAEHEGRVLWLRQILLVCFGSWTRDEAMDRINPFIQNCLQVAARFQIDLDELFQNATVRDWIKQRAERGGQASEQSAYSPVISQKPYPIRQTVLALRDSCAEASQIFHQVGAVDATEESYAEARARLLPLLRQLRQLENAHEDLHQDYTTAQLHLEIYDILISIAMLFERRNPLLGQQLRDRKWRYLHEFGDG
ncbi:MAG: hypothetical protein M1830_003586 [Pleopsidium flavum]|nr:MAG: hypothetical protein M1830_003586 [Pleopsidium flavum]